MANGHGDPATAKVHSVMAQKLNIAALVTGIGFLLVCIVLYKSGALELHAY